MDTYLQFIKAAKTKDVETLARLIKEQPAMHAYDGDDGSLLDVIRFHCPEFFDAAFAAGLSPDSGPSEPHQTLLQHAVCENKLDLVRTCLRHGANLEARNSEGETALGQAASWGTLDCVQMLVEAGANVNAVEGLREGSFFTPLDSAYACDSAHDRTAVRDYLLQQGAKRYSELAPAAGS